MIKQPELTTSPCDFIGYIGSQCLIYNQPEPLVIDKSLSDFISVHSNKPGDLVVRSYQSDIILQDSIVWESCSRLSFIARDNIRFTKSATIKSEGPLDFKSGMNDPNAKGTVIFDAPGLYGQEPIQVPDDTAVRFYYNPVGDEQEHKYRTSPPYMDYVSRGSDLEAYKLINTIQDLRDMRYGMSIKYALGQDIVGTSNERTLKLPVRAYNPYDEDKLNVPFGGTLDGQHYKIANLVLGLPHLDDMALFSECWGSALGTDGFRDLTLENMVVTGSYRVGVLCGNSKNFQISNVKIKDCTVNGQDYLGGIIGSAIFTNFDKDVEVYNLNLNQSAEHKGTFAGGALENKFEASCLLPSQNFVGVTGKEYESNKFTQCPG